MIKIEPWMVILIVFGTLAIVTVGLTSYRYIKKVRDVQLEKKQKLYDSCLDILNLEYLIVIDKKSGLAIYTQNLTEKVIDAALISGILQAIDSFKKELNKAEDESELKKLEYKNHIILMAEFVNIRLILIMDKIPSRFFLYSIEELAYSIYKNFGETIDSFNGDVKTFHSIEDSIEALLKNHLIGISQGILKNTNSKVELSQAEKEKLKEFYKRFKKGNDGDDLFPYPYIFKPPSPPRDLGLVGEAQAKETPSKKESDSNPYCKYCGAILPLGQSICHTCGKKVP